jgi:hypothetical protein
LSRFSLRFRNALLPFVGLALVSPVFGQAQTPTAIHVDASTQRHPISPLIYGVAFADAAQLQGLNCPLNRSGGNNMTRYNWQINAHNNDDDWYFLSGPDGPAIPGGSVDDFIRATRTAKAQPMVTIPMIGWVANLGPNRQNLWSFSVAKYGPQQKTAPGTPDDGNGVKPDGTNITGNDPNDADVPSTPAFQAGWVSHLNKTWGTAAHGGVRYYIMDNEPGLWNSTHRDVHPQPTTLDEYQNDFLSYATMVKSLDPNALIIGPENWGWPAYTYSSADNAYRAAHQYQGHPDMDAHGGLAAIPYLLTQMHHYQQKTGKRLLDVLTVHYYPQSNEFTDDVSSKVQAMRNVSTRSLWDTHYKDQSWINDTVMLIPRLKNWVAQYDPGTKIGITEYSWGAENNIGGATAEADVLGIFGRESLDLACRWTAPKLGTPTFKAMQMYRNYNGHDMGFGDVSVSDVVPDPDTLSSFAAIRRLDGALTVMVVNKEAVGPMPLSLSVSHFASGRLAQAWQLTSANAITRLPGVVMQGGNLTTTLPAQSITLFVLPR